MTHTHIPLRYHHWTYVWIPVAAATMWFSTLLAMIIDWGASGRPKYVSQEGTIAYISDVGADVLKPLFVTGCAITGIGFFLTLLMGRLLRHTGRLMPNMHKQERVMSILAIVGSIIGAFGLLFLSIFDTKRFPRAHRVFLLVFIVGVALSAIFSIIEYRMVSHDFIDQGKLKKAYIAKAIIATTLIVLAIAFGITLFQAKDAGAILEWIIAFGFTFYLLSFFYDLRLSKNVERGELKALAHPSRNYGESTSNGNQMTQIV